MKVLSIIVLCFTTLAWAMQSSYAEGISNLGDTLDSSYIDISNTNGSYASFTVGGNNVTVNSVSLKVFSYSLFGGVSALYSINIMSDAAGTPYGGQIGYVGALSAPSTNGDDIITIAAEQVITLNANTTYWIWAKASSFGIDIPPAWAVTNENLEVGDPGWSINSGWDGGSFTPVAAKPQMSIQASAVPEPSVVALIGAAVAFGFVCHRRRG